ncbi:DMT family transporter [Gephyromycinifex aptenodytis]|uniref:DMT family transporter n=1 Tax=Gephyromycinifex aptenodytis TaxID=2716227 RepID=UPI0014460961|nr:SMR family transporter [Gephyromycinifex aptenodytis]
MAWLVLIISGLFETVWASALAASDGFRRLGPVLVFILGCTISMGGLAFALRVIPVGTGYAVWTGVGAIGTAVYGMAALGEPATLARIACLGLIVSGIIGLKLIS